MQYRLKDIAIIERKYEETSLSKMFYNKLPSIGISVSINPGENIVEIGENVEKMIASIKKKLPLGIDFHKVYFQSDLVSDAIGGFVINLIESILIVIFIIVIAMGWRSGIIVGVSLLLTIVGTFPFLLMAGGTIQRVSLGAFIVAMGMLVDNAIVVIDGIYKDLKEKKERKSAILNTPKQTAWPLLVATLIAILAFIPVYLSPDETGTYTTDLFLVLAISLLLSWFMAIIQVPLLANHMLKISTKKKKFAQKLNLNSKIKSALNWVIQHPKTIIITSTLLLFLSFGGFLFVKQSFFPNMPYSQNFLQYKLPEGKQIKRLEHDLNEITDWLLQKPEVKAVTSNFGGTPTRYSLVRSFPDMSIAYGELIIDYIDIETEKEQKPIIEKYIRKNYPDAFVKLKNYSLMYVSGIIEVEFSGNDINNLKELAEQAQKIFSDEKMIDKATIRNNWEKKTPYVNIQYNQSEATQIGAERRDVSMALLMANQGIPVARYFEEDYEIPINIKVTDQGGENINNLENIPVWGANSIHLPIKEILNGDIPFDQVEEQIFQSTPLSAVADVSLAWEEPLIRRTNGMRSIIVMCDPLSRYTGTEVLEKIKTKIESLVLPVGIIMQWKGESGDEDKALKYILMYLPVALIGIIILLLALFKSYRKMGLTIICLAFSFIGVVPAFLISGKEFGFLAIIGLIGLMGMMIKNAIVLIEEIDRQIDSDKEFSNAIIDSSLSRVKPVMMASLTTILGMIPLVSDVFFGGLAVTIMGGLFVGSIITLVLLPLLYSMFFQNNAQKIES